ncbi:hypothetical protein B0H66DRAFT_375222 [Apodospora peruviana]|uniref:Uncharacterized protein n=1 Tax=Apodospora peruviana TaxID=516989 RepID=A0AAE0M0C6_9PEZI|nr:hypothetical protein B0H66DRAFT_375222 [Apodospora peruviana]
MLLVLLAASLWTKPPYMPVRPPNTIAAYIYYLCDSKILDDFGDGLEAMGQEERDKLVSEMGKQYAYGEMTGAVSGERRMGVDHHTPARR